MESMTIKKSDGAGRIFEIGLFAGHKDISTTQQSYIFATEPLEDRVSAYEAAISGKMPDVNVFKGVQTV